jgi:hypothetical protein
MMTPRLIRLSDSHVVEQWPDLPSSAEMSSIQHHVAPPIPFALDPVGRRFALATEDTIHVVVFVEI